METTNIFVQEILVKEIAALAVKVIIQKKLIIIYSLETANEQSTKMIAATNAEIKLNENLIALLDTEIVTK